MTKEWSINIMGIVAWIIGIIIWSGGIFENISHGERIIIGALAVMLISEIQFKFTWTTRSSRW